MIKNAIYNSKSLFLLTLAVIFGFSGFALANQGDIDRDGYANLIDLSLFAEQWLETGCSSDPNSNWCEGATLIIAAMLILMILHFLLRTGRL